MLNRINTRAYGSDKRVSYQTTQANIDLMLKYERAFSHIKNGEKLLQTLKDMAERFKQDKFLTPKQMSFINEGIYEKFWTGIANGRKDPELAGATAKHDIKKVLRY
jgi:hypothetical protein